MLSSLAPSTIKQYNTGLQLWWKFCSTYNIVPYEGSVPFILTFLTTHFNSGASYGTLNSFRSALSLLMGPKVGMDDRIKRFFRGVFRTRPMKPKYSTTWDPGTVLSLLSSWFPNDLLSIERITKKLVTLLALTTGHRIQTLSFIKLNNIVYTDSGITINISDLIKTSRHGGEQPILKLSYYNQKREICPVHTVISYIKLTKHNRKEINDLIITCKRPYKKASTQTIGRWIKSTMKEAGIDTSIFSSHSTRHASTSAALRAGMTVDAIRKCAGWSRNSSVFAKFYNRPVLEDDNNISNLICDTLS